MHASTLMIDSVESIFSEDLIGIGALHEIREQLLEKRNNFHNAVIEELQNIIYSGDVKQLEDFGAKNSKSKKITEEIIREK